MTWVIVAIILYVLIGIVFGVFAFRHFRSLDVISLPFAIFISSFVSLIWIVVLIIMIVDLIRYHIHICKVEKEVAEKIDNYNKKAES